MTTPNPALRAAFIQGMSHAAATVNIVTTDGQAGRAGVTVSAMSSVSADAPRPTLLVCVHHQSPAAAMIIENGVFCVNVLKDDQAYIADTFAGRFKDQVADKFDCADWVNMPSGAPRVVNPLVGFDCRVVSAEQVGTHFVVMGEVEDVFVATRGAPLIYANRAYGAASRIESAESIAAGKAAASSILALACFHTFGPYVLPGLMAQMLAGHPNMQFNLIEGDQRRVQAALLAGEAELGLLYDMGLAEGLAATQLTALLPYVLLAENHPLASHETLRPHDLAPHPMVLLTAPPSGSYFTDIMQAAGQVPNIVLRSASFEMVRGFVGHGLGYTILATRPAGDVSYDGRKLVCRPLITDAAPSRVVLAQRVGATLSPLAKQFAAACTAFFSTQTK